LSGNIDFLHGDKRPSILDESHLDTGITGKTSRQKIGPKLRPFAAYQVLQKHLHFYQNTYFSLFFRIFTTADGAVKIVLFQNAT